MNTPPLKVAIVDRQRVFADALVFRLQNEAGIEVVCSADDIGQAAAAVIASRPDVVILDAELSGGFAFDVACQIRRQLAFFQLPDLPLHLTDIGCEGVAPFGVACRQEAPVHHANQQDIGLEFARRLRERSIARGIDKLCRSIVTCSPSASSASLPGLNEIEILVYNNYGVLTCTSQNTILGYILGCGENGFVYPASCI